MVLDGNDPTNQDQLDWLDETLPNLPPGPTLVSFHQPAYSCASHGSTKAIDEEWVPRFEKAGVDLVLNGHDHDYQRFEVSGITYVVTGAGGRGLYSVGSCPKGTPDPIASNDTDHSFMVITVSADQIQAQAISNHGDTLDDFSLQTSRVSTCLARFRIPLRLASLVSRRTRFSPRRGEGRLQRHACPGGPLPHSLRPRGPLPPLAPLVGDI